MITTIIILTLCLGAYLAERAEKKSRKYYTDQWLLRASGVCLGAALALLFAALS